MRIGACAYLTLAALTMMQIGCTEPPLHQPGAAVPTSLDGRQPAGSSLVPGTIPPAHVTDTPSGEPPGSGLTKPN
jgi:hypothetical protein